MSENAAPERLAAIWSAEARADVRLIDREPAMQILYCWIAISPIVRATPRS